MLRGVWLLFREVMENMKRFIVALAVVALGGCGVESASTAATVAAMKKQEIEEGKKTEERMKQQINQAMDQARQRAQQAEDAGAK